MRTRLQWLRRCVQLSALALVLAAAAAAGRRTAPPEYGAAAAAGQPLDGVLGNTWSIAIGPVSLTDPLAGFESVAAARALGSGLLAGLAAPVLLTALLGRVFCSWACPAGLVLEVADGVRGRGPGPRRSLGFWRGHKYVLLAVGLLLALALSAPVLGALYPPAILARLLHGWAFAVAAGEPPWPGHVTWGALFLLGILLAERLVSRRAWCRYFCPGGALLSLLGAGRVVRVTPPDERCDRCGQCVAACGLDLNPMRGLTGAECDNCLACLSQCPPDALHLDWRGPARSPREAVE